MASEVWHIQAKSRKILRARRRRYGRIKDRNVQREYRKKGQGQKKAKLNRKVVYLYCPSQFNLITHPEDVISFINQLQEKVERVRCGHLHINIKMENIRNIDSGALALLLSKLQNFNHDRRITYQGNFPQHVTCKRFIIDSGFLCYMSQSGGLVRFQRPRKNMFLVRGFDKTDNHKTSAIIKNAVSHLIGRADNFKPVYSVIQEICGNSVEHANIDIDKKNWLLTVNHSKERVVFTMTDMGDGILNTIKRKYLRSFIEGESYEVLRKLFEKKYESRTNDINRNKGLPKIQSVAEKGFIENLVVITNDAYLDFSNHANSKKLNNTLNGTFYCWTLSKKCITQWKTRLSK